VLGKRSAAKLTLEEMSARNWENSKAWWATLAPEERSVEKRRAAVRKRNRARKAKQS
jgi:hypothetical protein